MKKTCFLVILLISIASLFAFSASAEESWYEIEGGVLTLRLDADLASGRSWNFEIADPALLELLTMEYLGDEDGEIEEGISPSFVASFMNFSGVPGETGMNLNYISAADEIIHTLRLNVTVDETGVTAVSSETFRPTDEIQGYADLPSPLMLVKNITSADGASVVEFVPGYMDVSAGEEFAMFVPYNSANISTLPIAPDASVMLPSSMDDPFALSEIADQAAWYNSITDTLGFTYEFYTVMETSPEGIASMEYIYVP